MSGFSGSGWDGGGAGGSENRVLPPSDLNDTFPFVIWVFGGSGASGLSWFFMSSFEARALRKSLVRMRSWCPRRALRNSD